LWLWDASYIRSSWYYHFHGIDSLEPAYHSNLAEDAKRIKQHFEAAYVDKVMSIGGGASIETYHDEAYGTGRWLRRLWYFAKHGFHSNEDMKRLYRLEQDWSEHCST
jgi:hypothetical protein